MSLQNLEPQGVMSQSLDNKELSQLYAMKIHGVAGTKNDRERDRDARSDVTVSGMHPVDI
jgi:hypothetical protein